MSRRTSADPKLRMKTYSRT